jgi:hypothetical protein
MSAFSCEVLNGLMEPRKTFTELESLNSTISSSIARKRDGDVSGCHASR